MKTAMIVILRREVAKSISEVIKLVNLLVSVDSLSSYTHVGQNGLFLSFQS